MIIKAALAITMYIQIKKMFEIIIKSCISKSCQNTESHNRIEYVYRMEFISIQIARAKIKIKRNFSFAIHFVLCCCS